VSTEAESPDEAPTLCIANIGPRQRRLRMWSGIAGVAIGIGLGVALVVVDAPRWARLGLFVPYLAGTVGIFQARAKT
jgi:hypothetical protein